MCVIGELGKGYFPRFWPPYRICSFSLVGMAGFYHLNLIKTFTTNTGELYATSKIAEHLCTLGTVVQCVDVYLLHCSIEGGNKTAGGPHTYPHYTDSSEIC